MLQRRLTLLLAAGAWLGLPRAPVRAQTAATIVAAENIYGDLARQTAGPDARVRQHRVRLVCYNGQATDKAAERLLDMARRSGIAVVGVTETQPAGPTVEGWMLGTLDAVGQALAKPAT